MLHRRLLVLCVILGTFLAAPAATAASGCHAVGATKLGDDHYLSSGEVWEETNGIPGLQKTAGSCADGTTYEADTKVAEVPDVPDIPWCIGNICIL